MVFVRFEILRCLCYCVLLLMLICMYSVVSYFLFLIYTIVDVCVSMCICAYAHMCECMDIDGLISDGDMHNSPLLSHYHNHLVVQPSPSILQQLP